MQRWKAAALASVLCSSVLSIWMCRDGLLLSHRLGPALAPLRRPPRTLDARIARLAQSRCASLGGRSRLNSGFPLPTCDCNLSGWEPPASHSKVCTSFLGLRSTTDPRIKLLPCCRPTAYEDEVSFLDTNSRYHTVHELSARECACV
ncbi:PREDICTED: neurturin [Myotis davidii]|uniref:neurturin n=1 Tax=Myotis davidii TaxID=225400 RepID=UPI0007673EE3|nr:PREDICTED: neurturin [Myotis davidii]